MLTLKNKFPIPIAGKPEDLSVTQTVWGRIGEHELMVRRKSATVYEAFWWKKDEYQERYEDTLDALRLVATFQWLVAWDKIQWGV